MKPRRSVLAAAIEREDWEAAALCLLLGVARAARKLPPETLEEMIELLAETPPHRQRERRRRGHP
jgi:hypothetical protein